MKPATTEHDPAYAPPASPALTTVDAIDTSDARVVRITTPGGSVLEVPRHAPRRGEYVSAPAFTRQLSLPAQEAFARADAFRRAAGRDGIGLEHLLVGLHGEPDGPAFRAFAAAGVSYEAIDRRLRALGYDPPRDAEPHDPWRDRWGATTRLEPVPALAQPVLDVVLRAEELASVGPLTAGVTETVHLVHALARDPDFALLFGDVWPNLDPLPVSPPAERAEPGAEERAPEPPVTVRELDTAQLQALVASLSISARRALGVADAFRRERGGDAVHMEHLVLGTHAEPGGHQWYAFDAAGLPPEGIAERLARFELRVRAAASDRDNSGTRLQMPRGAPIDAMPPLSAHVRLALSAAAFAAGWPSGQPPTPGLVQARHLLTGIFAVRGCTVVGALADARPAVLAELAKRVDQDVTAGDFSAELGADQHRRLRLLLGEPPGFVFEQLDAAPASAPAPPPPLSLVGSGTGAANDRPEKAVDGLGFDDYADAFAALIASPDTTPPITLGVFGSWGAGKSFLLERIKRRLAERAAPGDAAVPRDDPRAEYRVQSVHFNAWAYNAAQHIWPRLVRCLLDEVERHELETAPPERRGALLRRQRLARLRKNARRKLRDSLPQLAAWSLVAAAIAWVLLGVKVTGRNDAFDFFFSLRPDAETLTLAGLVGAVAGLLKLAHAAVVAPLGSWVTALTEEEVRYGSELDYMSAIKRDLKALDERLDRERRRVFIVIDDLDRCAPDKAIEVLQAINLIFDYPGFVVCLGIDARVITAIVDRHYGNVLGPTGVSGYEYLDKIVQIPFRLPEPSTTDLRRFLALQLPASQTTEAAAVTPEVAPPKRAAAPSPTSPAPAVPVPPSAPAREAPTPHRPVAPSRPPEPRRPAEVLRFAAGEREAFESAAPFMRPNPRHVKRLINVYGLVRSLARARGELPVLGDPEATVRWLVLCAQWPYAARELLRQLALHTASGAPDPADPPLRWLLARAAPQLDPARRARFDDDAGLLDALVTATDGLSWDELRALERYTLNFNPALESALRVAEAPRASAEG